MKSTVIVLAAALTVLLVAASISGGMPLVAEGFMTAGQTALQAGLLIIAAFLVIGQLQVLVTSELIKRWMQKFSGFRGLALSSLAGGLFPGGPYIFYPFLAGFKGKGIPFYIMFAFISGKLIYDFTRLPLEISLITPFVALVRYIITLPVPLVMGLLSRRFFPQGIPGTFWDEQEQ